MLSLSGSRSVWLVLVLLVPVSCAFAQDQVQAPELAVERLSLAYVGTSSTLHDLRAAAPVPGTDFVAVGVRTKVLQPPGPWKPQVFFVEPDGEVSATVDVAAAGCRRLDLLDPIGPDRLLITCRSEGGETLVSLADQAGELLWSRSLGGWRLRARRALRDHRGVITLLGEVDCVPALGQITDEGELSDQNLFAEVAPGVITHAERSDDSLLALVQPDRCREPDGDDLIFLTRIGPEADIRKQTPIAAASGDLAVASQGVWVLRNRARLPSQFLELIRFSPSELEVEEIAPVAELVGTELFQVHALSNGRVLVAGAEQGTPWLGLSIDGSPVVVGAPPGPFLRAPDHKTFVSDGVIHFVASGPRIDETGTVIPLAVELATFRASRVEPKESNP